MQHEAQYERSQQNVKNSSFDFKLRMVSLDYYFRLYPWLFGHFFTFVFLCVSEQGTAYRYEDIH